MTRVHRVLPATPVRTLDEYRQTGGGDAIEAARAIDAEAVLAEIEAAGLRGRGGAGFPTARKWRTVMTNRTTDEPATVVVNGAEGEPATFKDRAILRANPYQVVEGALIAARVVGADRVIVAVKRSFGTETERLRAAIAEMAAAGWIDGVDVAVFEGPEEYLYGEETALLEVIDGRLPFPRIAPPYRRGVDEVELSDHSPESPLPARVVMAGPGDVTPAPPTLVNNVETMANVPGIVRNGAAWFRELGTEGSPGTIVCTVIGDVGEPGVGEVALGTPLRDVIDAVGSGGRDGRNIAAVLPGAASAVVRADELDTPLDYESMAAIGSGVGSGGFTVFDDSADMIAVAAGVARFLAVESCGQCTPCKQDGLAIADILARTVRNDPAEDDEDALENALSAVADEARCFLASQQQAAVGSIVRKFPEQLRAHWDGTRLPAEPMLVSELIALDPSGAHVDETRRGKQPDWSYDDEYSGQSPADRFGEHRAGIDLRDLRGGFDASPPATTVRRTRG